MEPLYPYPQNLGGTPPLSVSYNALQTSTKLITIKAKLKKRYRQFEAPIDFTLSSLNSAVKEQFDLADSVGANVHTAYILWLFFGFFGIHRWYLKMHTCSSFLIWFITGQFFGLGWIYDGITLYQKVKNFNSYSASSLEQNEKQDWFNGYNTENRPNMAAAYFLWFFFGWLGIHRWYTGYHTPSSFTAWFVSGQMFGMGWLYDIYYTNKMVNYPRPFLNSSPFFVKVLDKKFDYVPLQNDKDVENALSTAYVESDRTLRVIVVERKREDLAYLVWFFFGIMGGHAWYLQMGNVFVRFFTANYFFFGYVVDGIRLQELVSRVDRQIGGDFVPSWKAAQEWPPKPCILESSFETV